ncbi:STAS domain-containing protein [Streptomyces chartreusis]|uniref:STAS domain-containing protein n=1 Tax=Streptomyces chartreusis TaxID=1969 RepID=UPI0036527868
MSYEDGPDGITVVRIEGDGERCVLDAASAPALRSVLLEAIGRGSLLLVVDMSAVSSVDRAGLGVLVGGLKRVRGQGGALGLAGTNQQMREILAATRLDQVFGLYETAASALVELAADYAETSIEQRRADLADRANHIVPSGGHSYEHVSDHVTVVTVVGDVDVYTAPYLRELLVELVNHGRVFLVLDMTTVDYLDSTGFGVVLSGLKRVRAHDGRMALVVPDERIRKIFRTTGLIKVFHLFDTVEPAVEFLGREVSGVHG